MDFGSVPGTIVFASANEIQVTSPGSVGGAAGPVDVTVVNSYGRSSTSAADQFNYFVAGPVVTGLSPTTGPVAGQTTVTISGSSLANPTAVYFGALPATILSSSSGQIVVTSPAAATTGAVNVTVVTAAGTSAIVPADQFTYGTGPTISVVGSGVGPANIGGFEITIGGANLAGATEVDFGTSVITASNFLAANANSIRLDMPDAPPGTVNVTVTTPLGTSAPFSFTFTARPFVVQFYTDYNTLSGPTTGGTTLMISGFNMADATAVNFGDTVVPVTNSNYTDLSNAFPGVTGEFGILTLSTPPHAVGTVNLSVTTPEGTSIGVENGSATFTYDAPPTVSGVSPASGPLGGGNVVVIVGTGLSDVTRWTSVLLQQPVLSSAPQMTLSRFPFPLEYLWARWILRS